MTNIPDDTLSDRINTADSVDQRQISDSPRDLGANQTSL